MKQIGFIVAATVGLFFGFTLGAVFVMLWEMVSHGEAEPGTFGGWCTAFAICFGVAFGGFYGWQLDERQKL